MLITLIFKQQTWNSAQIFKWKYKVAGFEELSIMLNYNKMYFSKSIYYL